MKNMDKGLTVLKWVQIVRPKIPQMSQNLSAQFGISMKKGFIARPQSVWQMIVVVVRTHRKRRHCHLMHSGKFTHLPLLNMFVIYVYVEASIVIGQFTLYPPLVSFYKIDNEIIFSLGWHCVSIIEATCNNIAMYAVLYVIGQDQEPKRIGTTKV